ncbi:aquaporin-7-like isoform X2 [Gigantopelta aegis]|uniref:aquaporin-7-like isoform X2 n=1 Tax=Gigantopelta aegis TaxID=1735272 RepID=UPI001B88D65A|nr:aquaporin-7-like isoform X2 [Gigantopelta aegis]
MQIVWNSSVPILEGILRRISGNVHVDGGHINPSVTIAQACIGRFPWRKVPVYVLAQYCGSFVASVIVFFVYTDSLHNFDGGNRSVEGVNATAGIWSTYPQPHVSTWNGLGDQVFGTAILLICVLAVTDKRNAETPSGLVPISVGLSVVAIGMTFGYNCGYAINPARDLAPRFFTFLAGWGAHPFSFRNYNWFWVPIVGPHVGAVVGAIIYQILVGSHWPKVYVVTEEVKEEISLNKGNGHVNEDFEMDHNHKCAIEATHK